MSSNLDSAHLTALFHPRNNERLGGYLLDPDCLEQGVLGYGDVFNPGRRCICAAANFVSSDWQEYIAVLLEAGESEDSRRDDANNEDAVLIAIVSRHAADWIPEQNFWPLRKARHRELAIGRGPNHVIIEERLFGRDGGAEILGREELLRYAGSNMVGLFLS